MIRLIFICSLCLMSIYANSQLNLKVAYQGLRTDLNATNTAFQTFDNNNQLDRAYGNVHYLQGLDLGARYKYGFVALEVGWNLLQSKKVRALSESYDQNWRISSSEIYSGIEIFITKHFGLGASLGYNNIKYKQSISGSRDRKTFVDQDLLTSKFYVFATASSSNTAISIKPYYLPKWGQYDLTSFNQELNGDINKTEDFFTGFGISVTLYNGPQD